LICSLSKPVIFHMVSWQTSLNGLNLAGVGRQDLLATPMTAFFASRQCPGTAIRAAMDWALNQAREKNVVVSGFHSPLEQSVLKVLIAARSPAVVVLARPVGGAKLPPEWVEVVEQGTMAVVSAVATTTRLTDEVATARNCLVAQLASGIVVAHASAGGALEGLCAHWQLQGRLVNQFSLTTAL
jgi:predicted Rossmann fold nucleotide-binding protein DprA/Smf involved in DNA uptake